MFEKIKSVLSDISECPNIYVSLVQEYVLEPISDSNDDQIAINDYIKYLKFTIVKKQTCFDRVIYKASIKENNPKEYLEEVMEDLTKIKCNYMKVGATNE